MALADRRRHDARERVRIHRAAPARRVAAGCAMVLVLTACGGASQPAADASPAAQPSPATAAARGVRLKRLGRFTAPVHATSAPGDRARVFVVEQAGRIRIVGRRRPFLDIRRRVTSGGEQGLLSVAFAPDYATSRRFYVYYTSTAGNQRIVEYRAASATRADRSSGRLVLEMPDRESNHNGGLLLFGPDKRLYVGTGDGGGAGDQHGSRGNAQDKTSLLGKLLRIDPARAGDRPYTVPASNPFAGAEGARPEIYAYGLRNPWRFSFDRKTGDLSIGDVGQDAVEEIDFARRGRARGANFGWRVFEGDTRFKGGEIAAGAVRPVLTTRHSDGNCSITGGVVVRDRALRGLYGRYVFGDFCKGRILSTRLRLPRASAPTSTGLRVPALASFGEDGRGRVLVVSGNGAVSRIVPRG